MSAKHTRGPWMAAAKPSSVVGWPVVAPRAMGRSICNVTVHDEARANAAMIAAAPEMYDALCRLISSCEKLDAFNKPHNMLSIDRLDRARAAIAKAEGRS